jgi:Tfp pilus assembly protein PilF
MQCNTYGAGVPHKSILILCIIILLILANGCSQSSRKVSYITDDTPTLDSLSSKDDTSSMQGKSARELTTTGFIYLANENIRIAELHFAAAINKDPKMVDAYIGLGRIEMFKENYSAAIVRFGQARELDPQSVYALTGEARALRLEGKLNAAIKTINAAMAVDPKDINVIKELAMIYDLTGKENLSGPLYHEIIAMAPDQAENHNNLGLNYMVRAEYNEAVLSFLRAHAIDKENIRIKNNLASAYLLSGNKDNAIEIFKATVGEAGAYNNVGYLLMTQGKFDEAERAFKKALQLNPSYYVRAEENLEKLKSLRKTARAPQP